MIEQAVLSQLLNDAYTGKITWLQASRLYPIDDFIDAFFRARARMQSTIADLTDALAAYTTDTTPIWSISETVTHLIFSKTIWICDVQRPC
ncbi:MAG TPA: hypothetical protein VMT34_12265 [Aggregatilineales bacterium]|nr:hypothetical protein [Aggregatilineales bacterium]